MDRRTFLKTAIGSGVLATAGGLATPAISQRAAARALRLVPHADLANFDPIWTTAYIARNAGSLVWDTLWRGQQAPTAAPNGGIRDGVA
jgi:peptide/nickel transport system substrate-binding protein